MDARALIHELVGTDSEFGSDEITELLRSMISTAFAEVLGSSEISALDLAAHYHELSEEVRQRVVERIDDEYGLDIPALYIVNISLPEEVEKAVDARSSMQVIGNLAGYQQYQMGQSMPMAASNPAGGGAADGLGLGMGFAMARHMMPGAGAAPTAAPPPPPVTAWHVIENGQTRGPLAMESLAAWLAEGRLTADSLVWCAGMSGWTAARAVPQLAALLSSSPPAPPPPPG